MSGETSAQERGEELLRSGRRVLLTTAGYEENQTAGLGDLAKLPSEQMVELLHHKTVEAEGEKAKK